MESLLDSFKGMGNAMYEMYCNPHELAAIWLNMPVMTDTQGVTVRIEKGMKIRYDDGYMSASRTDYNKQILVCYGTLIDQFKIKVMDIETGIEEMITLSK